MSKRAKDAALKKYPEERQFFDSALGRMTFDHNAPKREGFIKGYEQAEKDLGWHSVDESLPEIDEEVIVLRDELGVAPMYNMSFGHLVDYPKRFAMDYNGWNVPGVKFWMPCPKIPNQDE